MKTICRLLFGNKEIFIDLDEDMSVPQEITFSRRTLVSLSYTVHYIVIYLSNKTLTRPACTHVHSHKNTPTHILKHAHTLTHST